MKLLLIGGPARRIRVAKVHVSLCLGRVTMYDATQTWETRAYEVIQRGSFFVKNVGSLDEVFFMARPSRRYDCHSSKPSSSCKRRAIPRQEIIQTGLSL